MSSGVLFTDGGSRGNPGPSGFGFVLTDTDGASICKGAWFLPRATNNVAEYSALVWGLQNAREARISDIKVFADSELMVKQILGLYKVKSPDLKPLFQQAQSLLQGFERYEIAHVYREENKEADAMANEAMDATEPVGDYLISWDTSPTDLFGGMQLDDVSGFSEIDELDGPVFHDAGSAVESSAFEPPIVTGDQSIFEQPKGAVSMNLNSRYEGRGKLSGSDHLDQPGIYELTIKDHFDAAHELPGYDGPCQYLHGHTWDVEVTIQGSKLDEGGILYDFKDIKRDLHALLENFDHRYINDVPPFDRISPTAEHMARVLYFELQNMLPLHITLNEVAVWESPIARVSFKG